MKASHALGLRTAGAYGLAAVAGAAGYVLHVPLPWMIGPLVVAAVLSMSGFDFLPPPVLRRVGQLTVGSTVGLNVTAAVALSLPGWFGIIVLTALVAIVVCAAISVGFARSARIDQMTAFYAMMPGGLSEMGNIASLAGARAEPVAVAQALRVGLVVFIVPPLLLLANGVARGQPLVIADPLPPLSVALVFVVGLATALIARRLRLNNPWGIGPLIITAVLTCTGLVSGHMPPAIFFAGQVLLGFAIGSLFRRELLYHLPRVAIAGALFVLLSLAVMAGYAALLAACTSLDVATALLASSSGGMSEMSATAQALHIGAALVAMFHVCRAILVNGFATFYWALFKRIGFFDAVERVAIGVRRLVW